MSQPSFQDWLNREPAGPKPKKPLKRTKVARVSKKRRRERVDYSTGRAEHLAKHPLCQLAIALLRFDEAEILADLESQGGVGEWLKVGFWHKNALIPRATQIHHRNKCRGARLTDARWFASAGQEMHDWVEGHKEEARAEGYLLPLEADQDGRLPDGTVCLTTDEWLAHRARNRD